MIRRQDLGGDRVAPGQGEPPQAFLQDIHRLVHIPPCLGRQFREQPPVDLQEALYACELQSKLPFELWPGNRRHLIVK